MASDHHIRIVQELYAAFGAGDTEALLNLLADDVTFIMPALPGVPLQTVYQGKQGFRKFLEDREPALTYTKFDPRQFFSDQDHVIALGETEGIVKATGKPFGYQWVHLFAITDGNRVQRIHEFMDTHALVTAFT